MKSLKAQHSILADFQEQLKILEHGQTDDLALVPFSAKAGRKRAVSFKANRHSNLSVNVGKMCNQVCKHCHVDASPDRKEIMIRETHATVF